MAKERTRLNLDDLDSLLPGDTITIGTQDVMIRPLGLFQYKNIVGKLKALMEDLKGQGVTLENFNTPENILILSETLINKFPEILEEASNIAIEDLNELSIDILVPLIDKCLEVNLKSKDSLMGNWQSLIGKINQIGPKKEKVKESLKSSKN
jgi:hypothetical protein